MNASVCPMRRAVRWGGIFRGSDGASKLGAYRWARDSLLAGVIDSVSGRLQLPADELNTLTAQADAAAMAARETR